MKQLVIGLLVATAASFGVSQASSFTLTITPVSVCQDDGSDCTTTTFDQGVVDTIFAQANITVDLAPEVEIRNSTVFGATGISDYLFSVENVIDPLIGSDSLWFAFAPSTLPQDAFTLAFFNEPGVVLRESPNGVLEAQTIARGISRNLGLGGCEFTFTDAECTGNLLANDPLNIGNNLLDAQIATIQQSPFLEADPVPLPAAAWVFLTGLSGLVGWRRRQSASS
ncbi:MAG: VPLPA-CTERM sorting domain-containing protein [Pseudomonadota bacterium]